MSYKRKEVIGDCTLYLGDCLDIYASLDFECVVTDPPYGIKQAEGFSGSGGFSKPIHRKTYKGNWDKKPADLKFISNLILPSIIWGGNYFTDQLPQNNYWLVWDKQNTMPTHSDCELAWTNIKKNSVRRIIYNNNGCMAKEKERFHPTQKPVEVMKWCISHLPKDCTGTILDPFMGSASTLVACAKMGRKGIGIELDPEYFDIACKRVEAAYKQPDMFGY